MCFLNQKEAARALGVSRVTYARMEANREAEVDSRTALACSALWHRQQPWPKCRG